MKLEDKNRGEDFPQNNIPTEEEMLHTWDNVEELKEKYPKPDMEAVWDKTKTELGWNYKRRLFRNSFFRYAAAILLPALIIGSGVFYAIQKIKHNSNYITYNAPQGERSKIKLPDGSVIWLQPESSIKYPKSFTAETREVQFTGQAYFKIQKNPDKPFTVKLNGMNVTVLGTQFYIKDNENENLVETSLISGSVKVTGDNVSRTLVPNDVIVFSKSEHRIIETKNLNDNSYHWENGNIVFENCTFSTVLQEISGLYNIPVKIDENLNVDTKVTLTIREESIQEILDILRIIVPFDFQVKQNEIIISSAS